MKRLLCRIIPMLKYIGMYVAMVIALAACSDNPEQVEVGPEPDPDPIPEYPNEPVVNEKVEMVSQMVVGFVRDADGNALSGVTVTTGNQKIMTDNNGFFYFQEIGSVSERGVFRFSKEGYFDIVRSFEQTREQFDVVMYAKGNGTITASETFTASEGKDVEVSGMKVEIPASSLVDESGNAYSGQVQMDMIYMDPNNEHFADMMPGGDLTAIRSDNSSVQLVSYGMVGVNLTGSDGKELQLKEGEQSTVTFPVPEGMGDDAPETIPLWHFNENAGVWVESGEAVRQGNEYVGTVGHFSYWNLDSPKPSAVIEVTVTNTGKEEPIPVQDVKIHIGQSTMYTGSDGRCSLSVPANTSIVVYMDYDLPMTPDYRRVVSVSPGRTAKIHFTLPSLPHLKANVISNHVALLAQLDYVYKGTKRTASMTVQDGKVYMLYQFDNTNPATFSLYEIGSDKRLYTRSVELRRWGVDLGTIDLSGYTGLGGKIVVKHKPKPDNPDNPGNPEDPGEDVIYIPEMTYQSGIMIIDDEFYATSTSETSEDTFDMIVSGYSSTRTTYNNVFALVWEGGLGFSSETLSASIVEEDNELFRINLSGRGAFVDEDSQVYDENAELASAEIVMPLLFQGKRNMQVSSWAELNLPDFAPQALSLPDMAIIAERGNMCEQGGMLYYKGISYQDYLDLAESIKQEGKVDYYFEDNYTSGDYAYGETVFTSGDKVINVYYESSGLGDIFVDDSSYVMSVMVMDGVKDEAVLSSRGGKSVKKSLPFYRRSDKNVRR